MVQGEHVLLNPYFLHNLPTGNSKCIRVEVRTWGITEENFKNKSY